MIYILNTVVYFHIFVIYMSRFLYIYTTVAFLNLNLCVPDGGKSGKALRMQGLLKCCLESKFFNQFMMSIFTARHIID